MKLLLSVAALFAVAAGPAIAQQKGFEQRVVLSTQSANTLLGYAANDAVQKDLGVSDDVAPKLTRLRHDFFAALDKEYENAGFKRGDRLTPEQREKLREIERKIDGEFMLKATMLLSTDQLKRLRQIDFQGRLGAVAPETLLASDVRSELKLTDEQQQKLRSLEFEQRQKWNQPGSDRSAERFATLGHEYKTKAAEILTEEQKPALNKLTGTEFDLSKLRGQRGKGN
jgi:hypothetical protein